MKTILKRDAPECLTYYQENNDWSEIATQCKDEIARVCFEEQNGFCVYCERELVYPNWQALAHCEHLVPRSTGTRVFDHTNITLSCNGTPPEDSNEYEAYGGCRVISCGHGRDRKAWRQDLFLHAVDVENIGQYFSWNLQKHKIKTADTNDDRANNMIELLELNNPYLRGARNKARGAFRKTMSNTGCSAEILEQLAQGKFAFSSYLGAAYLGN